MKRSVHALAFDARGALVGLVHHLQFEWRRLPVGPRSPLWPGLLAAAAILGLLLAFHQVVRGAVVQGEIRRAATVAHAHAASRCNSLTGLHMREDCLVQLNDAPLDGPELQARSFDR